MGKLIDKLFGKVKDTVLGDLDKLVVWAIRAGYLVVAGSLLSLLIFIVDC